MSKYTRKPVSCSSLDCVYVCVHVSGYSLSHVAFGGGVEGSHLHCTGVLWSHFKQHLLKGVKLIVLIHIVLVDLKLGEQL